MSKPNFAPLKLFITGPTYIRDDVKQAALLPEFGHRDAENDLRFAPIRENPEFKQFLRELDPVLPGPGPGP